MRHRVSANVSGEMITEVYPNSTRQSAVREFKSLFPSVRSLTVVEVEQSKKAMGLQAMKAKNKLERELETEASEHDNSRA